MKVIKKVHEVSLCKNLLAVVLKNIPTTASVQTISHIYLDIGQLLAIDIETLRFAFRAVAQDTPAAKAHLEIQEISGQGRCSTCQCVTNFPQYYTACPSCGNFTLEVIQGEELSVRAIKMEAI